MKNCLHAAVLLLLVTPLAVLAQADATWETEVRQFDNEYWQAFNSCDTAWLAQMNTEDLEFYHDVGGVTTGRAAFAESFAKNICARTDVRVKREAVAGSRKFYPMRDGGKLYGAIVSGEHRFYEVPKGGAEVVTGQARFTHMLVLRNGTWKVSRVLSFDHGPARTDNPRPEAVVSAAQLDQLAGHYVEKDGQSMEIKRDGGRLTMASGPSVLVLKAAGLDEFFAADRPLTMTFTRDGAGKGRTLTVREKGKVVAEAARR